jgi:protein gp37
MSVTKIEWADRVWNPVRGCSRVSQGCDHCYAERMATRFSGPGGWAEGFAKLVHGQPHWTGRVALVEDMLLKPLSWRAPADGSRLRVFVNSMSDLFHEDLPDEAIDRAFAVMALCPHLDFLILTKRPERMREYLNNDGRAYDIEDTSEFRAAVYRVDADDMPNDKRRDLEKTRLLEQGVRALRAWQASRGPLPNVWLGVSVEDQATADERGSLLLDTPAAVHFVSYEPALGPVDFTRIDGMERYRREMVAYWEAHPEAADELNAPIGNTCEYNALTGEAYAYPPGYIDGLPRLDWIICGGESGPGARPMHPDWARSVRDQCAAAGVAFFLKQMSSGKPKPIKEISEFPTDLQIREFPNAQR